MWAEVFECYVAYKSVVAYNEISPSLPYYAMYDDDEVMKLEVYFMHTFNFKRKKNEYVCIRKGTVSCLNNFTSTINLMDNKAKERIITKLVQ